MNKNCRLQFLFVLWCRLNYIWFVLFDFIKWFPHRDLLMTRELKILDFDWVRICTSPRVIAELDVNGCELICLIHERCTRRHWQYLTRNEWWERICWICPTDFPIAAIVLPWTHVMTKIAFVHYPRWKIKLKSLFYFILKYIYIYIYLHIFLFSKIRQ